MCDATPATYNADGSLATISKPSLRLPGQTDLEAGWRWCRQCQGLFRGSHPAVCPSPPPPTRLPGRPGSPGGVAPRLPGATRGHDGQSSGQYSLYLQNPQGCVQAGWHACVHCSGLFYAPGGAGRCPASASGHAAGQRYLVQTCEQPGTQSGWRWCHRCGVLYFGGGGGTVCPAGGAHDGSQSGTYFVPHVG